MKKICKRILMCICVISLIFTNQMAAKAEDSQEEYLDNFLLEREVPQDVISSMPVERKQIIYEKIKNNGDSVFDSYEESYVTFEDDKVQITPYTIPKSELKFSVVGFNDGNNIFSVFPSFEWLVETKTKCDVFAYAFNANYWEIVGNPRLAFYMRGVKPNGDDESIVYDRPTTMGYAGVAYRLSGVYKGKYDAHGEITIKRNSASAPQNIIFSYCDYTSSLNPSIGVSFGPFSISFTNTPLNYRETAELMNW